MFDKILNRGLRAIPLTLVSLSLLCLASPAGAVGTIAFSLSQQLDQFGTPLGGCQLFTIQAGTTSTPQNAFKDTGLTNPQPNPMSCDGFGRLPQFFLADGQIKIRLTDKFGNPILTADNIMVVGPSAGGGSGATIDPTTILATGDLKQVYGNQVLSGWVRFNGRTIGGPTSGASERANADVQALYQYLWAADTNLVVVGGRGVSSIADWNANKQLTLPDGRGRGLAALDDMGNAAAGRYGTATFAAGNATTLGSTVGSPSLTLLRSDLPNVAPTFAGSSGAVNVTGTGTYLNGGSGLIGGISGGTGNATAPVSGSLTTPTATGSFTPTGTVQSLNGNVTQTTPITLGPKILVTIYIKL